MYSDMKQYLASVFIVCLWLFIVTTPSQGEDVYTSIENLIGSEFDDTLTGDPGDNTLGGLDGDDTVTIIGLIEANPDSELSDELNNVLDKLLDGLEGYAEDPTDLEALLKGIEKAVGDLEETVMDGLLPADTAADLINPLLEAARELAVTAIDASIDAGGDLEKIEEALVSLAWGDTLWESGFFADAVDAYKDALRSAEMP